MIKINVIRDKDNIVKDVLCRGHAEYADSGRDIICAAVSAIIYSSMGYLQEKCSDISEFVEKDGYLHWKRNEYFDDYSKERKMQIGAVFEAMVIGLKQVEASYGKKYLIVKDQT